MIRFPWLDVIAVLVIMAIGVWLLRVVVEDDRKLRLILSVAWILVVAFGAFGVLR